MKKYILMLLALVFLLGITPVARAAFDDSGIKTKYIYLCDANSPDVSLYEKNADAQACPASTTKILTCIIALERGGLDDEVTVGDEVTRGFTSKSSLMGLSAGETVKLRDLLHGIMLVSGNDAAAAIAVHIGGSMDGFASIMNEKAASLGMVNSHFVNAHGVDKDEHYTTARDMAKVASYALQNKDFRDIVSKRTYDIAPTNKNKDGYHLENTNRLVHTRAEDETNMEYRYAIGIKTGDTPNAQRCLIAAAEKDGVTLVSVQLYDEDRYERFNIAKRLFDWGFENYRTLSASELNLETVVSVPVKNYSFDDDIQDGLLQLNVDLAGQTIPRTADEVNTLKENAAAITASVMPIGEVSAPIQAGDLVATVAYQYEGKTLFTANAYASRDVKAMGTDVAITPEAPFVATPIAKKGTAGPWLFIILMLVLIAIVIFVIAVLRNRNKRRRNRRRTVYAYRGRR